MIGPFGKGASAPLLSIFFDLSQVVPILGEIR
jgi:hypothetical protein